MSAGSKKKVALLLEIPRQEDSKLELHLNLTPSRLKISRDLAHSNNSSPSCNSSSSAMDERFRVLQTRSARGEERKVRNRANSAPASLVTDKLPKKRIGRCDVGSEDEHLFTSHHRSDEINLPSKRLVGVGPETENGKRDRKGIEERIGEDRNLYNISSSSSMKDKDTIRNSGNAGSTSSLFHSGTRLANIPRVTIGGGGCSDDKESRFQSSVGGIGTRRSISDSSEVLSDDSAEPGRRSRYLERAGDSNRKGREFGKVFEEFREGRALLRSEQGVFLKVPRVFRSGDDVTLSKSAEKNKKVKKGKEDSKKGRDKPTKEEVKGKQKGGQDEKEKEKGKEKDKGKEKESGRKGKGLSSWGSAGRSSGAALSKGSLGHRTSTRRDDRRRGSLHLDLSVIRSKRLDEDVDEDVDEKTGIGDKAGYYDDIEGRGGMGMGSGGRKTGSRLKREHRYSWAPTRASDLGLFAHSTTQSLQPQPQHHQQQPEQLQQHFLRQSQILDVHQKQQQLQQQQKQQLHLTVSSSLGGQFPFARVICDYKAYEEGELELRCGEVVEILEQPESGWWTGRIGNRTGKFIATFVQVLQPKPARSKSQVATGRTEEKEYYGRERVGGGVVDGRRDEEWEVEAGEEEELPPWSFPQIVPVQDNVSSTLKGSSPTNALSSTSMSSVSLAPTELRDKWTHKFQSNDDEPWTSDSDTSDDDLEDDDIEGQSVRKGDGFKLKLPLRFSALHRLGDEVGITSTGEVVTPRLAQAHIFPRALAIHSYTASPKFGDDELSFQRGDLITIYEQHESGWWTGEIGTRYGLLPSNYVALIGKDRMVIERLTSAISSDEKVESVRRMASEECAAVRSLIDSKQAAVPLAAPNQSAVWRVAKPRSAFIAGEKHHRGGRTPSSDLVAQDEGNEISVSSEMGGMSHRLAEDIKFASTSLPSITLSDAENITRRIDNDLYSIKEEEMEEHSTSGMTRSAEKYPQAKVLFDYKKQHEDEIDLHVGESVLIYEQNDSGWWTGEIIGEQSRYGLFPHDYVTIAVQKTIIEEATIGMKRDDSVLNNEEHDNGERIVFNKSEEDSNPIMHIKEPDNNKPKGKYETSDAPWPMPRFHPVQLYPRARVIFKYIAQGEDEMDLNIGETVDVMEQDQSGWWTGECEGRYGLFPSSFVQLLGCRQKSSSSGSSPPVSRREMDHFKGVSDEKENNDKLAIVEGVASKRPLGQTWANQLLRHRSKESIKTTTRRNQARAKGIPKSASDGAIVLRDEGGIFPLRKYGKSDDPAALRGKDNNGDNTSHPTSTREEGTIKMNKSDGASEIESMMKRSSHGVPAKVLHEYKACQEDELNLRKDEIILVYEQDASGWWTGECGDEYGLFPKDYVQLFEKQ